MKSLLALLLFVAPAAFAADTLTFAEKALQVELSWVKGPRTGPASSMKMEWKNGVDQSPIEPPGPVKVALWMEMPGHGGGHGSRPTTISKSGDTPGVYQVDNMFFTMGGEWEIRVDLTYSTGLQERQVLKVQVPGGGHRH